MILTINKPFRKSGTTCYGNDEMYPICQQCSDFRENHCENCDSRDAYTTLNGNKLCKDCMYEEVLESGLIICNADVVLEFLRKKNKEFREFILEWYTKE